jgi:hypothetical protein
VLKPTIIAALIASAASVLFVLWLIPFLLLVIEKGLALATVDSVGAESMGKAADTR